jgi:riboflavin synthase
MFTGLIEELGVIDDAKAGDAGTVLRVSSSFSGEVVDGDSVAVNGLCLTVVSHDDATMTFDVMNESLRRSSLGDLEPGAQVNLERAVRADTRLGGHVVSGHVDGVGTVLDVTEDGFARVLRVAAPPALLTHVVERGSICLQGVSLTVSAVDDTSFSVSLIPETLERTTLGAICAAPAGRRLNLETDIVAKHVEKLVAATLPEQLAAAVAAHLAENGDHR